jgi:hypothetical protein
VDAADQEKFETAKKELQELMSKPPLAGIPLLVLANKNDLPEAVGVHDTIELLYESHPHPCFTAIVVVVHFVTDIAADALLARLCAAAWQGPQIHHGTRGVLLLHLGQEQCQHQHDPRVALQALQKQQLR